MEVIHTTSQFRWGHEVTNGMRMVEPDPSIMTPYVDEQGNEVKNPDGTPVLVPPAEFEPEYEQVGLDTVVVIDASTQEVVNVFKFSLDKQGLARFLTYYVQFLDTDGRQELRTSLAETSDIVPATVADIRKLELVKN